MCGICGYMSFSDEALISPETICRMTDATKHRGPNDSGCALFQAGTDQVFTFKEPGGASGCGRVALGHRRLSIIDLSSLGHQPMSSADGNLWLCLNGEIYNYLELRETLESYGCQFRSKTDTEVALQAYKQWGPDCFNRFNGMCLSPYMTAKKIRLFSRATASAKNRFIIIKMTRYLSSLQ